MRATAAMTTMVMNVMMSRHVRADLSTNEQRRIRDAPRRC